MTIQFKYEQASAKLVFFDENLAVLRDLLSQSRGRGHARELMQKIVDYADERKITLLLRAQQFGHLDNALNNAQLEVFYKKFGFVVRSRRPTKMIRYPRKAQ